MLDLTRDDCRFSPRFWLQAAVCCAWALVSGASAQTENFKNLLGDEFTPKASSKAVFSANLTPPTAKAGDEVTLNVTAKLPPHSYIFAMTGEFQERTQIETKRLVGLEPLEDEFHPDRAPETKMDDILKQELSKFHGDVTWSKKFRVAENVSIEKVAVDLQLTGQYCTEDAGGQCTLIKPPVKLHAAIVDEKPSEKLEATFQSATRPKKGNTNPVELKLQLGPAKSTAGKTIKLTITMVLDENWHTFSTTMKEGEGGTATEIAFEKLNGLKRVGKGPIPSRPPEIKVEENAHGKPIELELYHKEVTWTQEFEVLPGTKTNAYGLEGTITYQTCHTSCLPPRSVPFSIGVTSEDMTPPQKVDFVDDQKVSSVDPFKGSRAHDKGLLVFLLTAIGAASVSLLTPCVFPMVPITVSFFLKQNEAKSGRPLVLALVFCGAIIASFVVLGVGIAALFGATKLNALANNSYLNLFLAGVFFAFALNMLGAFEIQVPSWLLSMTASGEQAGGFVGVIFMALTFVLTSFSCTFAFVGSLLVAASQGQYYWPVLGMLAFGTTFASPFFLLAMAPGMLKKLPKSGGWLNSVKVVMGFVELGVAIKYFSIVDQVWNSIPVLFDFTNVMTLWCALSICTGLYLLGQFRLSHDSPVQGLSPARVLIAGGFLILGGLFAIGVTQPNRDTWLLNQLVAFAPARLDEEHELDFDKAVAYATLQNKPLFIDFTGVNCVNCRLMEKRMTKSSIHRRLDQFVQAQLYADKVPKISDPKEAQRILNRNVTLQTGWFGDVTLPSYAVVTPDGKTILSTFLGLAQQDSDFARFLDEGYDKWRTKK